MKKSSNDKQSKNSETLTKVSGVLGAFRDALQRVLITKRSKEEDKMASQEDDPSVDSGEGEPPFYKGNDIFSLLKDDKYKIREQRLFERWQKEERKRMKNDPFYSTDP